MLGVKKKEPIKVEVFVQQISLELLTLHLFDSTFDICPNTNGVVVPVVTNHGSSGLFISNLTYII